MPPSGIAFSATRLQSAATSNTNHVSTPHSKISTQKKGKKDEEKKKKKENRPLTIQIHTIPPPIHRQPSILRKLQRKKHNHQRHHRPAIQRRARHIIKLAPPRKAPLPDNILKHEPDGEPRRVVDARRGRDRRDAVEHDGRGDEFEPRVGVAPLPEPEGHGEERADEQRVEVRVVDGARAELPRWADETPASSGG